MTTQSDLTEHNDHSNTAITDDPAIVITNITAIVVIIIHVETWLNITPFGEQGWRSGEKTRLPSMWLQFDSRTRRHMWVEFVVGSLLAPRDFSLVTPDFYVQIYSTFIPRATGMSVATLLIPSLNFYLLVLFIHLVPSFLDGLWSCQCKHSQIFQRKFQ